MTPDEWRERIGTRIEQRRKDLKLSIRAAARAAEVSESLWRQVETGVRPLRGGEVETANPRPGNRAAIARALGWDVESIDAMERGGDPMLLEDVYEVVRRGLTDDGAPQDQVESVMRELDRMQTVPSRLDRVDDDVNSLRDDVESEVSRLEQRIAVLERAIRALAPAMREVRRHARMDADDELDAILAGVEADEDHQQSP